MPLIYSNNLTLFLYPSFARGVLASNQTCCYSVISYRRGSLHNYTQRRKHAGTSAATVTTYSAPPVTSVSPINDLTTNDLSHLDPSPDSYTITPFTDACTLTLSAGSGGHGCVSFLREKFIPDGPANGGDGGTGGSVYIQAVRGETSLHKLARRGILKAGRGKNGQGKGMGGERGEDLLVTVPVGTVVREIWRHDPVEEEELQEKLRRGIGEDAKADSADEWSTDQSRRWRREKWLLYPGTLPSQFLNTPFPALPRPRRSNLTVSQPPAPLNLDLDKPMDAPMLLAAGAMGGLGNPHFVTKSIPRPKFATKGEPGMALSLHLELKLLADVGLVGLPNAGKSTLLRSLSNSKARIGNWAFTTLQPNIGTVVLDDYRGRPRLDTLGRRKEPITNFTIADIPGLIEDAHLDRGLGLGFLRHIERAAVLAFVVDLHAGDAVTALKGLWREVGEYEALRDRELNARTEDRVEAEGGLVEFKPFESRTSSQLGHSDAATNETDSSKDTVLSAEVGRSLPPLTLPPISSKPWFVIATKADLPETKENFAALQNHLMSVQAGKDEHPSGKKNAWRKRLEAVPVSAIKGKGVQGIPELVVGLLDG
ncbi:GTPase of the mitochondrial inner membrane that associates with the large ribosomal subunit [Elasticomyces elasticus]|nr:GTPase of the mitochondrial inner membrane that associates with the large ribosomal subunit [Elasticomyces elasticus]